MMPSTSSASGSLVTSSPMLVIRVLMGRSPSIAVASSRPISSRSPSRWTTRPSTITWTTSAAVAANTAVCSSAPVPAVRGVVVSRVTRSARAPTRISPASGKPRLEWPVAVPAVSSSAALQWPRLCCASRSSISTARISSNGSITAWLSLPRVSGLPASWSSRLGPTPSPRSRSVVGQKQATVRVVPRWRMSSVVTRVACTAVVIGPEDPVVGEQLGRGGAVRRHAGVVLLGLLGDVHVQRPAGRRLDDDRHLLGRHRADGVDRGADHGVVVSAQLRGSGGPALRIDVGVAQLRGFDRRPEPAAEVAGVEQRDPDAGLGRRLDQGVAHRVRVVVRRPVRLVVQVVELADAGDPGRRHLAVGRPRQREVAVGVEPLRHGVHLLAPGPERAAARAGSGPAAPGGTRGCGSSRGRAA